MTATSPADADDAAAYQEYQAAEHRIRDEYVTAVKAARRAYERETAPARDAYDHAELIARVTYNHDSHANWHRYLGARDHGDNVPQPRSGYRYDNAPGDTTAAAGDTTGPRPTFTPRTETEQ